MHLKYIPENHNLNYWLLSEYQGLNVQCTTDQPLVKQYLEKLWSVLMHYTQHTPRVMAVRIDLHCPFDKPSVVHSNRIMQDFKDALDARIAAYLNRRKVQSKRTYPCKVMWIWAREQKTSGVPHFHLLLLFNQDVFHSLGEYHAQSGSLMKMIQGAWNSALKIPADLHTGLYMYQECGLFA
ncbi:hypothetical protein LH51_01060 [Nitrincola sp. A-D6]|uniref:YagK/YfjJ domain-containing protein n=1 Tax=Nitrincola sp. A-D6 TaxID=1545442 RepID=UPI00051FD2AB|nr:inovirus-type Gp2 protein [Nitrincola sp. A-D6]KGK43258.1 hypothetical protein LH51_01060 [Nitrincola sp. A-D6]